MMMIFDDDGICISICAFHNQLPAILYSWISGQPHHYRRYCIMYNNKRGKQSVNHVCTISMKKHRQESVKNVYVTFLQRKKETRNEKRILGITSNKKHSANSMDLLCV